MTALLLASGCGKQLNPAWCAEHADDPACRQQLVDAAGDGAVDAPLGCTGDPDCPAGLVCDTQRATPACVMCTTDKPQHCTGATPACGADNACVGCVADADCTTSATCLPEGACADEASVLYVAPNGTTNLNCTQAERCSLEQALTLALADPTRNIIKLAPGGYAGPFTIATTVRVIGAGATLSRSGGGPTVTVSAGADVELVGVAITSGTPGISCTGSTLAITQARIYMNPGLGLDSDCALTLTRSRIYGNAGGALRIPGGQIEIRNNVIAGNGGDGLQVPPILIDGAAGSFTFNTVALNNVKNNTNTGVTCNAPIDASGNIITANQKQGTFGHVQAHGTCAFGSSYTEPGQSNNDLVWTETTSDFHLTGASPPAVLNVPGVTCAGLDDIDGQLRPKGAGCDLGADELLQ